MKKSLFFFAVLFILGIVSSNTALLADPIANPKDTISIKSSNCSFSQYKSSTPPQFTFYGYTDDSSYYFYIYFKSDDFHAGTYSDTLYGYGYIQRKIDSKIIYYNNALGDGVVTIKEEGGRSYYTLTFPFVGKDSVLYNIDATFQVPYEKTYHQTKTTTAKISSPSPYATIYSLDFVDNDTNAKYKYQIDVSKWQYAQKNEFEIGDSVTLRVYDINDQSAYPSPLYKGFSGKFTVSDRTDSTCTIVGEIVCNGNIKFYLNCIRPTTSIQHIVAPAFQAYGLERSIVVKGAEGCEAAIYDVTGRILIYTRVSSNIAQFHVDHAGMYIVRVNGSASKVVVR